MAIRRAVMLEQERGAGFLLIPVFLCVGVVTYFSLPDEPQWPVLLAINAFVVISIWLARRRHMLQLFLIALLLCLGGVWLSKLETWRLGTKIIGSDITTRLSGHVVTIEDMASGRKRLTIDVAATSRPKLRYQPERVRISARKIPAEIRAGSFVSGLVRLLPPSGPIRPGSYDTSFASYFSGIGASGFFLSGPEVEPEKTMAGQTPAKARVLAAIEQARQVIAERIRHHIDGPEGEIAAALIVGVRAGIPEAINEAMRKTGIYHVISISGLHMALVAGTVMGFMRALFALFPDFSSRHPVRKYAALSALFAILSYLLISGMVVAAVRSFIMLAVMLIAILFDRSALTMRNLAISAIIIILVTPHEVVGPSFQMSFAATAALIGAYAAWSDYRTRRRQRKNLNRHSFLGMVLRRSAFIMIGLAATSIIAGTATTLYAAWHFQRIAPLSLLANLAIMPVVSVIVMPFAVFSSLAMPFGLEGPFLQVMGLGLSLMIYLSQRIAEISPIDAIGLISAESVLFTTIALVIATFATTWLRWVALPIAAIGLLVLGGEPAPDALISEDGRLLAVVMDDGQIAVNRARPNAFTMDDWRRAVKADSVLTPRSGKGFECANSICAVRHPSGAQIVQVPDAQIASRFCTSASLIVIEDATAHNPCRETKVAIITNRDLAQRGSAAVFFTQNALSGSAPEIRFAIDGKKYRPWHSQRAFSRAARGLPPYVPKTSGKTSSASK
ncbi:ComEC/Rec2 family competence protein [Aquamicrobium segne]|uniref:ComEC/Rec2 family competence protein n=1 Tax=Aquamicrobium segne TaxID=469547 RepID=A0ABW0GYM9_9HYPH